MGIFWVSHVLLFFRLMSDNPRWADVPTKRVDSVAPVPRDLLQRLLNGDNGELEQRETMCVAVRRYVAVVSVPVLEQLAIVLVVTMQCSLGVPDGQSVPCLSRERGQRDGQRAGLGGSRLHGRLFLPAAAKAPSRSILPAGAGARLSPSLGGMTVMTQPIDSHSCERGPWKYLHLPAWPRHISASTAPILV